MATAAVEPVAVGRARRPPRPARRASARSTRSSTLSSSPGRRRRAARLEQPLSGRLDVRRDAAGRRGGADGPGSCGPRSCRPSVNPYHSRATSASSPSTSRTSSVVHVWNRPSWPWPCSSGESASSAEKNPPAGWRRSRSTYSIVSSTTCCQRGSPKHQVGVEVDPDQQRLVVEHLLEVRHQPLLVDRVAGEAAADVVVHPAAGHRVERGRDDRRGIVLRLSARRRAAARSRLIVDGNFGAPPKPPHTGSNDPASCCSAWLSAATPGRSVAGSISAVRRMAFARASTFWRTSSGRLTHTSSIAAIRLQEVRLREVGAAVERLARRV